MKYRCLISELLLFWVFDIGHLFNLGFNGEVDILSQFTPGQPKYPHFTVGRLFILYEACKACPIDVKMLGLLLILDIKVIELYF